MKTPFLKFVFISFSLFLFSLISQAQLKPADFAANWPEWRGLYNTGANPAGNPPVEFSETKNVKWKIEVPGKGHATPIIWGNQIIIQTAVPTDITVMKSNDAAPANPMSPTQTDLVPDAVLERYPFTFPVASLATDGWDSWVPVPLLMNWTDFPDTGFP